MQRTTTKTISTISYNTDDFLIDKLNQLIKLKKIAYYIFIHHFAEKDETKNHIHLLIEPYGKIDLPDLVDEFNEVDVDKPGFFLGVMPFRITQDFGDWYFYVLHDSDYLISKGLKKEFCYNQSDMITSDVDVLNELVHRIDFRKFKKESEIIKALQNGSSKYDLLKTGLCSMREFYQYERSIDVITHHYSGKLKGFEMIDSDDEEILQHFN